jgi:hypothetical protein
MRWLNALTGSQNDPVCVVQRALSEHSEMSLHAMIDALDAVVRETCACASEMPATGSRNNIAAIASTTFMAIPYIAIE